MDNDDGDIGISSTGNITTTGRDANGIFAYVSDNGDVTVTSTGNVTTKGSNADGVYAYVYNDGDVAVPRQETSPPKATTRFGSLASSTTTAIARSLRTGEKQPNNFNDLISSGTPQATRIFQSFQSECPTI